MSLIGCAAAYFDDELAVECIRDCNVSQRNLQLVFKLLGAPPQSSKSFVPAPNRHYLGTSVHVGDFGWLGVIRFQPKTSTTMKKVQAKLHEAIATKHLRPDDAGKLRGDLNWLFSMCAGHALVLCWPQSSMPRLLNCQILRPPLYDSSASCFRQPGPGILRCARPPNPPW